MMDLNKFGSSYLLYKESVRDRVIALGGYASPEWFETQDERLTRAYNLGEPVDFIAETLAHFGRHAAIRKTKTPRQLAARVVRVEPGASIEDVRSDLADIVRRSAS